jgi:4-coumarate--CoA ligase (photoactive yellow protein activation family)
MPSLGEDLLAADTVGDWADAIIASRTRNDDHIAFFTSGSTGVPKRVQHDMAALRQEAEHWAEVFAERRRVLRAVPCHHIYGFLFGLMVPAISGVEVIDVRGMLPLDALSHARPGDLLVGHPGFFSLAARGAGRVAEDVQAVVSTAPCAPAVWNGLAARGVARVLEVYGASECAGIGRRWSAEDPFELLPWWNAQESTADDLQPSGPHGRPCRSPDELEWVGERNFRLRGRRDAAVQVGGVNVFPSRVRAVILEHPDIADAAVRPFDLDGEQRLKAYVVPRAPTRDPMTLRSALSTWLAERLTPREQPRRIDVGTHLPTTPAGKPADW